MFFKLILFCMVFNLVKGDPIIPPKDDSMDFVARKLNEMHILKYDSKAKFTKDVIHLIQVVSTIACDHYTQSKNKIHSQFFLSKNLLIFWCISNLFA